MTLFTSHPTFQRWRTGIFSLSLCAKTYIKLSGCFSEIPPSFAAAAAANAGAGAGAGAGADADADRVAAAADEIFDILRPWLAVVLAAFGPSRIMFASDWPVCTLGVRDSSIAAGAGEPETGEMEEDEGLGKGEGEGSEAWEMWRLVVERMCDMASMDVKERVMLWSGTAVKAYGIIELM
jgi:L-rhamnono-1,4-lactonase